METTTTTQTPDIKQDSSRTLKELMGLIHAKEIKDGAWDSIDPKHKDKGPVIAPLICNNNNKILHESLRLFQIGLSEHPYDRGTAIVGVIYQLLDFTAAHNIQVEKILTDILDES